MSYDREIRLNRRYPLGRELLWAFWGTREGLARFFGSDRKVELRVDGPFEIYFDLNQPEGQRGSEKCTVLRIEPPYRLAFSWNAPPHLPNCRKQHTVVEVRLAATGDHETELTLLHHGFGVGDEWDACLEYFEKAWPFVLRNLGEAIGSRKPLPDL